MRQAASLLGLGAVADETQATGDVTGMPSSGVVLLGAGDKNVSGGQNDIYIYSAAGGNVSIGDTGGHAQLAMGQIASTDVTLERPGGGNDLLIVDNVTGKTLTIVGQFAGGGVQNIAFSDGVSLSSDDIRGVLQMQAVAEASPRIDRSRSSEQEAALAEYGFTSIID